MSLLRNTLCIVGASFIGFSCPAQITVVKPIPARATITIDAGKPAGAPIPRTIFGSFLEPIGNSTYNGLWAELLINPSLEENLWSAKNLETLVHERPELVESSSLGLPLPWEPLNAKQGNRYEPRWGNAANSWRSLMVMGVTGQPTGIKQQVYLPISARSRTRGVCSRVASVDHRPSPFRSGSGTAATCSPPRRSMQRPKSGRGTTFGFRCPSMSSSVWSRRTSLSNSTETNASTSISSPSCQQMLSMGSILMK